MTKKRYIAVITNCRNCPNFDNEYYSYLEYCTEVNRKLTADEQDDIPADCPLTTIEGDIS